jgi:type II secretory pathway pseudopilin PulG
MGTGFGMLLYVYLIGILAAIMIPAYQDYTVRAQLSVLAQESQGAREAIGGYYLEHRKVPASLDEANVPTQLPDGAQLSLDPQQMILSVRSKSGELQFTPTLDQGHILWRCTGGEHMRASRLPPECR